MIHFLVKKHKYNILEVGMGTEPTANDTSSDDQELAKALAGMSDQISSTAGTASTDLAFEETPAPSGAVTGSPFGPMGENQAVSDTAEPVAAPVVVPAPVVPAPVSSTDSSLDGIKKDALNELRPLVDKLTVPPEEKFDTYLLLLRSTDDTSLIGPAHDAAKEIPDEARRAQALLDVIKEIDYLSSNKA
jgi:hypothetical protein